MTNFTEQFDGHKLFKEFANVEIGKRPEWFDELVIKIHQEAIRKCLEALKLWRPYFYRDKITEEDIKELKEILK